MPEATLRQILDSALDALADPDESVLQEMDRWSLVAYPIFETEAGWWVDTQRN